MQNILIYFFYNRKIDKILIFALILISFKLAFSYYLIFHFVKIENFFNKKF